LFTTPLRQSILRDIFAIASRKKSEIFFTATYLCRGHLDNPWWGLGNTTKHKGVSMNQNTVILEGVVSREPRTFELSGGKKKVSATVAIERRVPSSEGERVMTDYVGVTFWGKSADAMEKVAVGTEVQVTGRVRTGSYEKNGEKRWITEIVAEGFAVLACK
jgi:single-strand DNA-binding protein